MNIESYKRIAILIHGFAGITSFMGEIEKTLSNDQFDIYYDQVFNLSLYNSNYGLDFSKPYDLKTSIYNEESQQTLTHYFYDQLNTLVEVLVKKPKIDIFAHSMGGLVARSFIRYLMKNFTSNGSKTNLSIKNIDKIFLLGTPNKGTILAKRLITIPMDILVSGLNLIMEIPRQGISTVKGWNILDSQFMQMVPNSNFLKKLNQENTPSISSIKWITVRGLKSSGQLGMVWQPFIFRKFWFNKQFPFLHRGIIPNDGVVNADSVPLKFATNITVPEATHMSLLKWQSESSGQKVLTALKPLILDN